MVYSIDFSIASSNQIEKALCGRLQQIRILRNLTQAELAQMTGLSERTIRRMENGKGITLDTFIRVLIGLNIQGNLEALLPDPSVRPMDRIENDGRERKRASKRPSIADKDASWTWGDE